MIGSMRRWIAKRPELTVYVSFFLLALVTLYCAWYANYYLSGNSDDLIYPYIFHNFRFHDLILPGQHSNILKFPVFALQAIFPYTFATFTIVSIGLVFVTVLGWAFLLMKLFGRRYAPLICVTLASILLGSRLLNYDLLGTTIRNIEFPIVLAFIMVAGSLLQKRALQRRDYIYGSIAGALFALTLAGDSFFLYTVCASLFICLAFLWFIQQPGSKKGSTPHFRNTLVYAIGFTVLALCIRAAVSVLGIAKYYTAAVFKPHILPLNHLAPSLSTASTQTLDLFNANIFGQQVSPTHSLVFINFFLLVLGVAGLLYMLRDGFSHAGRTALLTRISHSHLFVFTVAAVWGFVSFAAYIASDLVVGPDANGNIVSLYQERYITLIPLLLITGIAYLVWRRFDARKIIFFGLPILTILVLLVNLPSIRTSHVYDGTLRDGPIAVAKAAKANHVQLVISGYWYGSAVRFWSHNQLQFTSVAGCNIPQPTFNTRSSWYIPSSSIHTTALVIVHKGIDASYWTCSTSDLLRIYGQPAKTIKVETPDQPELWIYNHDIRDKIAPMSF